MVPAAAETAPPLVLLVDDDDDECAAYEHALRPAFRGLVVEADPAAALALLADRARGGAPVAVVLSDQRMPTMTGEALLREAARVSPTTARVLVTAYHEDELEERVVGSGLAHDYVQKPVEPDVLGVVIESAIERGARGVGGNGVERVSAPVRAARRAVEAAAQAVRAVGGER